MNLGPRKMEISSEASPAIRISPIRRAPGAFERPRDPLQADAARGLHQHHVAVLDQVRGTSVGRPLRVRRLRVPAGRTRARSRRRARPPRPAAPRPPRPPARRSRGGTRPRRGPARACRRAPRPRAARRARSATCGEVIDGGTHRHGVGVVAVVDDENAVAELRAPLPRRPEKRTVRAPSASASSGDAERVRGTDRRQRVGDVVRLGEVELEVLPRSAPDRNLDAQPIAVRLDRQRTHVRGRTGDGLQPPAPPGAANVIVRTSERRCGRSASSAAGTTHAAAGAQLRDQLRLRLRDALDRPDQLQVHGADVRDHAHVAAARSAPARGSAPCRASPSRAPARSVPAFGLEHGQRQADLGVEVLAVGVHPPAERRPEQRAAGCPSSRSCRSSR